MEANNNKVSYREYSAELKELRQEMIEMERRIFDKIDRQTEKLSEKYATKEEVAELRQRSNRVDTLLGFLAFAGSMVASAFGIRQQ